MPYFNPSSQQASPCISIPSMQALFSSLLLLLLLIPGDTVAGDAPNDSWNLKVEHDALTAFRQALGHSVLDADWVGVQCFLNQSTWTGLQCVNNRIVSINLQSLGLTGQFANPILLANLSELALLNLNNNSISGEVPDLSFNHKLTTIDLSMNSLAGPMPPSLTTLTLLESLHLNKNKLNGSIPPFNQSTLQSFDVSYNYLSGDIPSTAVLRSFAPTAFAGNPGLCGQPTYISCEVIESNNTTKSSTSFFSKTSLIIIFIVLDLILLVFATYGIYILCKKPRIGEKKHDSDDEELNDCERENTEELTFVNGGNGWFGLKELLKSQAEGLGKGSFGSCYKAEVEGGRAVVVKRLRSLKPLSSEEFARNVRRLAGVEHRNLLAPVAYHYSPVEKLLIYNFARNGNLFDRIHGNRQANRNPFRWNSRLSVAKAVAGAMAYLHRTTAGAPPHHLPHGNLKSSNILLDDHDFVLVADYGLAQLLPPALAAAHMAAFKSPEYQRHRKVCPKSDVWSYGCLLVELITGKSGPPEWVHRAVREEWTVELFDGEIMVERGAQRGMVRLLEVALGCCERSPEKRPEMERVAREVEGIGALEEVEEETEEEEEGSTDQSAVDLSA